jgi:hypothetical protein
LGDDLEYVVYWFVASCYGWNVPVGVFHFTAGVSLMSPCELLNKLVPVGAWKPLFPLTDGILSDVQVLA